jgi:chromosome partitioning protein
VLIAVLGQKGGAGKTTLATNIAAAAHLAGQRTTLLDLDSQGSALDWFAARTDGSKLDGLAVYKADKALSLPKLKELGRGADVVVCDGPARLGNVTLAAAVAAEVVVIPLRPGWYDLKACQETVELLDGADQIRSLSTPPRPNVLRIFVLNGAVARTRAIGQAADALDAAERRACPVVIHNRSAFGVETAAAGESVLTMYPGSPAAREIAALYAHIMETVRDAEEGRGAPHE